MERTASAKALRGRSKVVAQEQDVVGDEHVWLLRRVDKCSSVMKQLSSPEKTVQRCVTPLCKVGLP